MGMAIFCDPEGWEHQMRMGEMAFVPSCGSGSGLRNGVCGVRGIHRFLQVEIVSCELRAVMCDVWFVARLIFIVFLLWDGVWEHEMG